MLRVLILTEQRMTAVWEFAANGLLPPTRSNPLCCTAIGAAAFSFLLPLLTRAVAAVDR